MSSYQLVPDVYRIQANVGGDGDIFGGIFIKDNPGILVGPSGGIEFVREFNALIDDLGFENPIRIYYTHVTFNELYTASFIRKKYPSATFYVHKNNYDIFKQPEAKFFEARYVGSQNKLENLAKTLPQKLDNVIAMDKSASFETRKTKILIVPFKGPQDGHTFIYSRDHKMLFSGIMLGRTHNARSYYIDLTGSFDKYEAGLSFLEQAKSEIVAPAYDEPEFTNNLKHKVSDVRDAITSDRENILDLCSLQLKSLNTIFKGYKSYYAEDNITEPYDTINLNLTRVKMQLEWLIKEGKLVKKNERYRIK